MFIDLNFVPKYYTKMDWIDSNISLTPDHLFINGELVMNRDEIPIMNELAKVVGEHGGDIVEAGYGMGLSAKEIDNYPKVKSHTIIESNKQVYQTLVDYQNSNKKPVIIIPVLDFFEDWVKTIPDNSYDGIIYDTFALEQEDFHIMGATYTRKVYHDIFRILKPGGVFTYFGNWETKEEDKLHLIKNGFKEEDISFGTIKVKTNEPDDTYPNCNKREDIFIIPKIYKPQLY